ncbi:retinoblastoma-binding protein 5 homolog [Folsomia candida]|uniref:retinoblastoma-binding protein 5 homolog n=1 Tax=Folsomia candida TaxID=158441 RepID=UPI000B8F77CC|nr:retinoblastoma-binding protein 5 homolog [Folsomia candida]
MNLELLESFGQNYPEEYDNVLDCVSLAVTAAFNKHGTLLAVGCNDGRVVVWDFMTRGIAKVITAHAHPVASVSWSRNGKKVLTACTDNTVCILDVLTGDCDSRYQFPSPVLKVQYHPRDSKQFLVCPLRHAALLVDVSGSHKTVPLDDEEDLNIAASFDRRGKYIFSGNAKGKVLVHSVKDMTLVASFRIGQVASSSTAVKTIEFSRRGEWFLINSADRIIRVYDVPEVLNCGKEGDVEPIQKLQDLVNKTMWKKCCFSGDGEYICAGSARQHALYIWEKSVGNLVKILHGTKGELLLDVVWHPMRPIIASISSGVVSIWAQNQVENWSAFAPDFKELDENVEYEERESEFDLEDEDKIIEAQGTAADDEIEVDVVGVNPIPAFCSSDEEDEKDTLLFLPIAPDIEDAEDQWAPPPDPINPIDDSHRRHSDHKENHPSSTKKKKPRTYNMTLENAPSDEIHPLLSNKPIKDKPISSKKPVGRPDGKKKDRVKF